MSLLARPLLRSKALPPRHRLAFGCVVRPYATAAPQTKKSFLSKFVRYSLIGTGAFAISIAALIGGVLLWDASTYRHPEIGRCVFHLALDEKSRAELR
jgi:hypothetical protein